MYNRQGGQTLIELIVVITVSVMVVSALVFATISSLRNASFAKNQAQATKLAQEAIEAVRTGRDRFANISNIPTTSATSCGTLTSCSGSPTNCTVTSWKGDQTTGAGSIWNYQIFTGCGSGGSCYFKLNSTSGSLTWSGTSSAFSESNAEDVYGNGQFYRAIILNDDVNSCTSQKTVTAVVRWKDFSGPHESRLSTVLRRI